MKTIAIVEDNPDNRLLLTAMLEEHFVLEEYTTGPDALAGLRAKPADLVLLDISLPEMDGPEVLRHLRRDPAFGARPVVALTAHAMAGDRERFIALGFDEYLSKPIVDEQQLIAMIERCLGA